MSLSIGIVGLPNVGKSSLFQALTKKQVDIANYPFATIDPNVGVIAVPDERLLRIAECVHSGRTVNAIVEFIDIAGLVAGAAAGEGLGNQFLQYIREVDVIVEVVRAFPGTDIAHVMETVDPLRDIAAIETELLLKDLETTTRAVEKREKEAHGSAEAAEALLPLRLLQQTLEAGKRLGPEHAALAAEFKLLSAKPVLYAFNVRGGTSIPDNIPKPAVVLDIKEELEQSAISEAEQQELGFYSRLPALVGSAYALLGLITFFTAGEKEARAWTLRQGTNARDAGSAIHSDFTERFIRASIVSYEDFISCKGWANARAQGKLRTEGRDYIVKDGDVVEFKI